jgi:hypothetical protein
MTEEAVISEPVSARWFPVPRENTGKFADFGLEIAKAPRLSEENSIACQRNSLVTKAGKICARSGNLRRGNSEPYANNGTRCLAPIQLAPAGSNPGHATTETDIRSLLPFRRGEGSRPCTHKSRLVSSGWSMSALPPKAEFVSALSTSALCHKRTCRYLADDRRQALAFTKFGSSLRDVLRKLVSRTC